MIKLKYRAAVHHAILSTHTNKVHLHARTWAACRFKGRWKILLCISSSKAPPMVPLLAIHPAGPCVPVAWRPEVPPIPKGEADVQTAGEVTAGFRSFFGTVSDAQPPTIGHAGIPPPPPLLLLPFIWKDTDQSIKQKHEAGKEKSAPGASDELLPGSVRLI
jgi:hypothetical protein